MVNRILTVITVVILVGFLFGCSSNQKQYSIDLIVKGTETDFWKSVNRGAQDASKQYNCKVTMTGPSEEKDYLSQVKIVENTIKRKPDAILIAAVDYNLMSNSVNKAAESGIPVLMVDSATNSDKAKTFIGTDNVLLGQRLATELAWLSPPKGIIGIVSFVKNSYPSQEREQGFRDYFKNNKNYQLANTVYCDSDFDNAENLTIELIQDNPDIVAIAGLNAQAATGAARALNKLNRNDIILAGIDCSVEQVEYIENGILDVAVLQNPYQMGYLSVENAVRYLNGDEIPERITTGIYVINKNNVFKEEYQQLIFPFK